jgi:hypothetical protein
MYAGLRMQVPEISREGVRRSPARGRWWRSFVACGVGILVAVGMFGAAAGAEKKSGPWLQLSLDDLGFPGVSNPFLTAGSSMLTVHFLDDSHLLVTYGLRTLVPRLPDDPVDDDDRLVAAEVVDVPSGHIEARTEWHMHDHGRYLWKLGNGRFLVRIGGRLSTIAPMANLAGGDAFVRTVFPGRPMRPSVVLVSPDGRVVTLETVLETPGEQSSKVVVLGDQDTAQEPVAKTVIDFYRIPSESSGGEGGAFRVKAAGVVVSPEPLLLPIDGDGYLWADEVGNGVWGVTFDEFGGKTIDLGKVESSCRPRLQMTSRSEFLMLTCRGSDDRIEVASYGMDGHETWEEPVGDVGTPSFAFAPAAARFAISSIHTDVAPVTAGVTEPAAAPTQEMRVYQNASGDLLLRAECRPVFKTAENFDLSDDGLMAAVVRDGKIAVYKLSSLSKKDKDDMAEVEKFAPPVSTENVVLKRLTRPMKAAAADERAEASGAAPLVTAGAAGAEAVSTGPRKRPTLLNPGEKPEFGYANEQPN